MRLLLDTHALLWWLADDPALGRSARDAIAHPDAVVFVSAVSIWEIIIKKSLGKLVVPDELPAVLEDQPFERLQMTVEHAFRVDGLPMHHRDPFDRLLIAQCLAEGLTVVTHDGQFALYDVPVLKA